MSAEITSNTFLTYTGTGKNTDTESNPKQTPETTVFFISGNPGLIGYYHPFLTLLSKYLTPKNENINENELFSFQIYGCSLGGFELNDEKTKSRSQPNDVDLDLEDQIRFIQGKLTALMEKDSSSFQAGKKRKIILIGHSVGAYIAMEILRRHREASPGSVSGPASISAEKEGNGGEFDIVGGAMLFPTVVDIAASASGRKLTV
jgi:pimeloyl-ACP methyl ester carboxylesterase